ncbi:hypothetical protein Pse7429DRAFT_0571 [Pseudanabaena biceps PCC 7429]|uniref:Uncharacterized protein n=1 Tax=Pseudanabaena biceps PCC 7429 TaxID=927668 RepID=L8N592_9CYAN|nr:hypothetical protein Pse7429DRAFT_0571 [Pseudanabaena biceps PCC 7429]
MFEAIIFVYKALLAIAILFSSKNQAKSNMSSSCIRRLRLTRRKTIATKVIESVEIGASKTSSAIAKRQTSKNLFCITNHQSPITNHQSPITNHQSPITNHQSPITNHQSPITQKTKDKRQKPITNTASSDESKSHSHPHVLVD